MSISPAQVRSPPLTVLTRYWIQMLISYIL